MTCLMKSLSKDLSRKLFMNDSLRPAKYLGCTLICLKDFIREHIDPINAKILIENVGPAFRIIFDSGLRKFITMGSLYDELYIFAEHLFDKRVQEEATKKFIESKTGQL